MEWYLPMIMKRSHAYLLSCIGIGLVCLHLLLTWRLTNSPDQFLLNTIFWGTIMLLVWQQRTELRVQSDWLSSIVGIALMGLLLCKSVALFPNESEFVRFFPGLAGLALAILVSGWRIHEYSQALMIMLIFILPPGLLGRLLEWSIGQNIQVLVAQSAAFLMHYLGVNLVVQGSEILLKQGAVRVEYACTGIPIWILLIQLSSLLAIGFRLSRSEIITIIGVATGLAWFLAIIRVAMMALMVAQPSPFEYWHGTAGGQIFSTIAIVSFALFCQYLPTIKQSFSFSND
jgi:cyanoexosortase A